MQFLNYSYRSASEVQSLLYVAQDVEYINDVDFEKLYSKTSQIKKMVGGFIKYLKSTTTKQ
ncbi:MAG: four helix bundle protein [Ignavibacteriae bacterium]|nr:four helix bundle protein [Ignavibacteriota bacterium]